jgi:predicted small lipoprotein YifL
MSRFCRMIVVSVLALALAACGVRGDLEPPPGSEPKKNDPFILDKII